MEEELFHNYDLSVSKKARDAFLLDLAHTKGYDSVCSLLLALKAEIKDKNKKAKLTRDFDTLCSPSIKLKSDLANLIIERSESTDGAISELAILFGKTILRTLAKIAGIGSSIYKYIRRLLSFNFVRVTITFALLYQLFGWKEALLHLSGRGGPIHRTKTHILYGKASADHEEAQDAIAQVAMKLLMGDFSNLFLPFAKTVAKSEEETMKTALALKRIMRGEAKEVWKGNLVDLTINRVSDAFTNAFGSFSRKDRINEINNEFESRSNFGKVVKILETLFLT